MSLDKLRKLRVEYRNSSDDAIELFFEVLRIDSDVIEIIEMLDKISKNGKDLAGDETLIGDRIIFCMNMVPTGRVVDPIFTPEFGVGEAVSELKLVVGTLKEKNFDKFILDPRRYLREFVIVDHKSQTYRIQKKKKCIAICC